MKIDIERHPIQIAAGIVKKGGLPLSFEFSKYKYEPRAIEDQRRSFRVDYDDLGDWVEKTVEELAPSEDLAFHSRVYLKNELIRHVPMIDLKGKPKRSDMEHVRHVLKEFGIDEIAIFDSGRSLHLYGFNLLTQEEWLRFLGRCLLVNLPDGPEIVDSRWVGHRLMAGYGTLRWTKNNSHYLGMPTKITEKDLP